MRHLWSVVFLASCVLQPNDKPDPDAPSDDPPAQHDDPPPAGTKRVFVTRGVYTGALTTYVEAPTGLAAGDLICNLRAKAAGLGGTWSAWLSSSTANAIDRVTALGPWVRLDGEVAFAQRAQLFGEPLVPLELDERGERVDPYTTIGAYVWTGTKPGGLRHADTCGDWTTTGGQGHYGRGATTFAWTAEYSAYCTQEYRLICLER